MSKRILIVLAAAVLALSALLPVLASAESVMYVYTSNGKTLNVRSSPVVADNIIKTFPFGQEVYVAYHLGNGWSALYWTGAEYDYVYVQTRFLVNQKPTKKPTPAPTPVPYSGGDNSTTVSELNAIFRTYYRVPQDYRITVRPVRASGWVNLRFAPTKQCELMGTYRDGAQLIVIAELKDWYQVEDPNTGAVGYISAKYVSR